MGNFKLDNYVEVKDRLPELYKDHPQASIRTRIVSMDDRTVVFEARIYRTIEEAQAGIYTSGFAREVAGDGMVNKTSHVENCETSAIGRALANLDYCGTLPNGKKAPRPSREEMRKAEAPAPTANPQSAPQEDVPCPDCQGKTWDNREGKKNPKAPDFKCRDKECEGVWWPGEWDEQSKRLDYIRKNWKAIPDTTTVELDGATVRLKPYIKDAADGIKANKELAKLIADTVDGIVSQGTLDGAA
jgi:hypothetical protein